MQMGPDWNKLYAKGQCLYYGVAFSDEQWAALNNAKSEDERNDLVRTFREEYMKNRDVLTGELRKPAKAEVVETPVEEKVEEIEESIEDVKPVKKTKKGK